MPAGLNIDENTTVVEETIRKLKRNNIEKIIVVLGYSKDHIKKILKNKEEIIIIKCDKFRESGSMASFALVSKYIDEDFILYRVGFTF